MLTGKQLQQHQGFSLLELMVVVFLMALFSTVGILRLGVGQATEIEAEAVQFVAKLNLLSDESLLSGQAYRIFFDAENHSYQYQTKSANDWQDIAQQPYENRTLKPNIALKFTADLQTFPNSENGTGSSTGVPPKDDEEDNEKQIFINVDGSITGFDLYFGRRLDNDSIDLEEAYWHVTNQEGIELKYSQDED